MRLKKFFSWFFFGLLASSFLMNFIIIDVASALPPGFSANFRDANNIVLSGGGFNAVVVTKSGTNYLNRVALFEGSERDDNDDCSIKIEIELNNNDQSRATMELSDAEILGGKICNIDRDMEGFANSQTIEIGNTGVFDDLPSGVNQRVSVCSRVKIERNGPFTVDESTPERTDTITIEQPRGTVVRTKQAGLSNGDSREDTVAIYCTSFNLLPGDYVAKSRLGEAEKTFSKSNGVERDVVIVGENEPLSVRAGGEEQPDCRDKIPGVVAWAVCAVIEWVDGSINALVTTLNNLLSVNRSEVETAEMRKAWSFFRNIASLLLVVIGLIMIIGQAISKE